MTATKHKSDFKLTTATPCLTLTGQLWGAYYENFEENWPHYNGTTFFLITGKAIFRLVYKSLSDNIRSHDFKSDINMAQEIVEKITHILRERVHWGETSCSKNIIKTLI